MSKYNSRQAYFIDTYFMFVRIGFSKDVAAFISAQSCLETAFGTSQVYKENHNLFGMKFPRLRVNLAKDERFYHAVYMLCYQSAYDYVVWLAYNKFTSTSMEDLDEFQRLLAKSGFNPYSDYISRIDAIYQQYKCLIQNL